MKRKKRSKKELEKRLRILIGLIAVLGVLMVVLIVDTFKGRSGTADTSSGSLPAGTESSALSETVSGSAVSSEETASSEAEESVRELLPIDEQELVTTDTSVDWNLVLVNPSHKLPDDFEVETSVIGYTDSEDLVFDSRAVDALDDFLNGCVEAGYSPVLRASYRSQATQEYLFENKIEEFEDDGYDRDEAEAEAATIVAVPGTSEHQLGLAADIASKADGYLNAAEADTPVQQWLMEHCAEYGFILRFPYGKSEYTGIIYEPWHYRYVGKEAAQEIMDSGMCLEEYLAAKGIGN